MADDLRALLREQARREALRNGGTPEEIAAKRQAGQARCRAFLDVAFGGEGIEVYGEADNIQAEGIAGR